MHDATRQLEQAAWAVAEGRATADERALLEADPVAWRRTLDRLMVDAEASLASVRGLSGPERDRVVADFEDDLARLRALDELLSTDGRHRVGRGAGGGHGPDPAAGVVVGRAGGGVGRRAGTGSTSNDDLADLLEAIGGPAVGWSLHPDVLLPSGARAEALAIPVRESLMWLVAVSGSSAGEGVGPSVAWMGRVALLGVRLVAAGAGRAGAAERTVRPTDGGSTFGRLGARPGRREGPGGLAAAMPGPVVAARPGHREGDDDGRARRGGRRHRQRGRGAAGAAGPAPDRPHRRRGGRGVHDPPRRLPLPRPRPARWLRSPAGSTSGARSVTAPRPASAGRAARATRRRRRLVPVGARPRGRRASCSRSRSRSSDGGPSRLLADELVRLERLLPVLHRPGAMRRGQVVLSQDEAWELMTVTGAELEAAGFDVRVPPLSRRRPSPVLRLFAEPAGESARRRPPAQQRALVGGVRRRGADCG